MKFAAHHSLSLRQLLFTLVLSLLPLALCLVAGCATVPKIQVPLRPGATVETVASMVSVSVKAPRVSSGGHGYMIYRRPDQLHLVMLTPFGTTALETFSSGDRLTVLLPSKGVAFAGTFSELPDASPLRGWRMIRLMAVNGPLFDPAKEGTSEKVNQGFAEITSVYDKAGFLERREFSSGEKIYFRDYQSAEGVAFPAVIEFADPDGTRVKITFDEPEVNKPVEDAALSPNLAGIKILPLTSFKGI